MNESWLHFYTRGKSATNSLCIYFVCKNNTRDFRLYISRKIMDTLKTRGLIREDCSAVFKLIRELASFNEAENELTIKPQDLETNGFNDDPPYYAGYVAEINNSIKKPEVIGVAIFHLKYSTWEGPVMHLNTLIVSEQYRRQGVGNKLLKHLAKIATQRKYTRISLEVSGKNEVALNFFQKFGAQNLTKEEAWLNYSFIPNVVKKIVESPKKVDNIQVRTTEPKDCFRIQEMIQELAEFEKMSDGPKLSAKDHQRNGFYKLHPDFYSYIAETTKAETGEKEIIGFTIFFLTFDPLKGKKIHLEDLYITPKFRTKGIGEMLFKAVAKFVAEGGYQGLTLEVLDWNAKAIQFYEKFGGTNMTTSNKAEQSLRFRADAIQKLAY